MERRPLVFHCFIAFSSQFSLAHVCAHLVVYIRVCLRKIAKKHFPALVLAGRLIYPVLVRLDVRENIGARCSDQRFCFHFVRGKMPRTKVGDPRVVVRPVVRRTADCRSR